MTGARLLRIVEYTGDAAKIADTVERSIDGRYVVPGGMEIVATVIPSTALTPEMERALEDARGREHGRKPGPPRYLPGAKPQA